MKRLAHPQALIAVALIGLALYALRHNLSSTNLLVFALVVPSIILHEIAHGVVALGFGDDTAQRAGRLTLNPVRHIDPFGTLILPAVLAYAGWGLRLRQTGPDQPGPHAQPPQLDSVVSLAGPATNLALAGLSSCSCAWPGRPVRPRRSTRPSRCMGSTRRST